MLSQNVTHPYAGESSKSLSKDELYDNLLTSARDRFREKHYERQTQIYNEVLQELLRNMHPDHVREFWRQWIELQDYEKSKLRLYGFDSDNRPRESSFLKYIMEVVVDNSSHRISGRPPEDNLLPLELSYEDGEELLSESWKAQRFWFIKKGYGCTY